MMDLVGLESEYEEDIHGDMGVNIPDYEMPDFDMTMPIDGPAPAAEAAPMPIAASVPTKGAFLVADHLKAQFDEFAKHMRSFDFKIHANGVTAEHTMAGQLGLVSGDISVGVGALRSSKMNHKIGAVLSVNKPESIIVDLGCSVGDLVLACCFLDNVKSSIGIEVGAGKVQCAIATRDRAWSMPTKVLLKKAHFFVASLNDAECYHKLDGADQFFMNDKIFHATTRRMVWDQLTAAAKRTLTGIRVLCCLEPRYMSEVLRQIFKYRGQVHLQYTVYAYSTEPRTVNLPDQTAPFISW